MEQKTPKLGDVCYNHYTKIYEKWDGKKWINLISKELSESHFMSKNFLK